MVYQILWNLKKTEALAHWTKMGPDSYSTTGTQVHLMRSGVVRSHDIFPPTPPDPADAARATEDATRLKSDIRLLNSRFCQVFVL